MKSVSRFEADLLRILHFFLGREPREQGLRLVTTPRERPQCLSRAAVELVQDSLAKGCPLVLAHRGAWRRERYLRGPQVAEGRLWERTPPQELAPSFSGETLSFLIWITATKLTEKKARWQSASMELAAGDLLVHYLACAALRGSGAEACLQSQPFQVHGLCRLAYPDAFPGVATRPDFRPWTSGVGACMLEALQEDLTDRWVEMERSKGQVTDWRFMRVLGQAQDRVLTPFLDAIEEAGRWDLARFLLRAAAELLVGNAAAPLWVGGLQGFGPRLADRTETNHAALTFLRHFDRLRGWERQARGVGYFDENYAASQLWKADWERWQGDVLHDRAQVVLRQVDPLNIQPGGLAT